MKIIKVIMGYLGVLPRGSFLIWKSSFNFNKKFLSERNELSHLLMYPGHLECFKVIRMPLCGVWSNAFFKSKSTLPVFCPRFRPILQVSTTLNILSWHEWFFLKHDLQGWSRSLDSAQLVSLQFIILSSYLLVVYKSEIGR